MNIFATIRSKKQLSASVTGADGKTRNLGRIDNKLWAPRAWYYRFVTFPRLKRKFNKKES